jgi:peptidyl-prolyl cis-trans isomerase D
MAIIQKIRDKYAKVAGGVIVLALVGFVLMDATSGGRSGGGLFGSGTTVAKVNGDKIDVVDYDRAVTGQEEQMRAQNRPTDENASAQLRDQVMNQMIMEKLIGSINEKLGLKVTEGELKEMMNPANPDPMVRQAFTNPQTGEYNAEQAAAGINQYERTKDPQMKAQWDNFKKGIAESKAINKLNALFTGSYYTPKFILDDQNDSRNNSVNIAYVSLPYSLISDEAVKVTDEDINKYIAARKSMFQIKTENRAIDFVSFVIAPAAEDSARTQGELTRLIEGFSTATDNEAFVRRNSSVQMPVGYFTQENLQQMQIADHVAGAAVGTVVGPFAYGQDMAIAKVLDRATLPDSVKVRHILVATKQGGMEVRTEEQAQARIDSLIAKEKAGVPFDSLIKEYSDDNIAQNPSGEYDLPLASRSNFTKEFGDYAFSGAPVGSSKAVKVESTNYSGIHYIQIMKKSSNTAASTQLGIVVKPLTADKNTYASIYAKASEFLNKVNNNAANFEKEATAYGLQVQNAPGIDRNSSVVPGLGSSRDIVRWAYESDVNTVSPTFTVGGNRIVIAKLTQANAPGLLKPTGAMKTNIENAIRQAKKAEQLIAKNKDKKSLEDIAAANGVQVATADSVNFAGTFIPGAGNEPKVVGYAFNKNFKENTLSPGIAGMSNVYYITVTARNKAAETPRDLKQERYMIDATNKNRAPQMIMEGIRQSAEVSDLRYKIYK